MALGVNAVAAGGEGSVGAAGVVVVVSVTS